MRSMNLMWDQREPVPFTPRFADFGRAETT
jgi:hypothetical protein